MVGPDSMPLEIKFYQPWAPGNRVVGVGSSPCMPGGEGESDGIPGPEPWFGALGEGNDSGHGMSGADCLKANWMSMKVLRVGTRDSSLSSETFSISPGFDLHILQKALSCLTWQLFKTTVLMSIFIVSTPLEP